MERVPTDLQKVLAKNAKAKAKWEEITPIARRDFISWVTSAKLKETRDRRVARVPDMLLSGKRRPCCFAVVPMNLYTALGKNQKAKATWRALTPDERRDFIDWVESEKDPELKDHKMRKALTLLAAGKRKP